MKLFSLLALAMVFFLSGCGNRPESLSPEDIEAHRAMSQQFLDYIHKADWQGLSEMYEDSAVVMQMYIPALKGRAEIREFWSEFPPIKEMRFYDEGIIGEGNLAYVYGRYWVQLDLEDNPVYEGKYLDERRRQPDGSWMYVAECANTSLPAELSQQ